MLSDFYPEGIRAWTEIQAAMQEILATRAAAGDDNLTGIVFSPQSAPYGEDWHPTVATHEAMAQKLSELLATCLGW